MQTKLIATQLQSEPWLAAFFQQQQSWLNDGFDLPGFQKWLTEPGMGFGDLERWWVSNASVRRPAPHEGIDLKWYKGAPEIREMGGLKYPFITDGIIDAILSDILGTTFLIRTPFQDMNGRFLYLAYAHSALVKDQTLHVGQRVNQGDKLLAVAESKTMCPSHLHLSALWAQAEFQPSQFDWATAGHNNQIQFINPLPPEYHMDLYAPAVDIRQVTNIGERLNYGFTKTRALLDVEDHDGLVELAVAQVRKGASFLTINIGNNALEKADFLREHIRRVQKAVDVPLAFDSTDERVLKICLETYDPNEAGGQKPIVNSIAESRLEIIDLLNIQPFRLVIMASERIEEGMNVPNNSGDEVLMTVKRILPQLLARGLSLDDIYVDVAIAPISSDMDGKVLTAVEAIKKIGSDPDLNGIHIMVGLTNLSQGLPTRKQAGFPIRGLIESAFLTITVPLGLDVILANPATNFAILPSGHFVLEGFRGALDAKDGVEALRKISNLYRS